MDKKDNLNLKKRYLIWLYKTTKEELDKIERKFTQLEIDKAILNDLEKANRDGRLTTYIEEFKAYIRNKESEGMNLKYDSKDLKPQYRFLELKLGAIENAIKKELGKVVLREIKLLYELEMTERILKSKEH